MTFMLMISICISQLYTKETPEHTQHSLPFKHYNIVWMLWVRCSITELQNIYKIFSILCFCLAGMLTNGWFDHDGLRLIWIAAVSSSAHTLYSKHVVLPSLEAMDCKPEERLCSNHIYCSCAFSMIFISISFWLYVFNSVHFQSWFADFS